MLNEACTEPTRTTQVQLCRPGSKPSQPEAWGRGLRGTKAILVPGLGMETGYSRAYGFSEPQGDRPQGNLDLGVDGWLFLPPRTRVLSCLPSDSWKHENCVPRILVEHVSPSGIRATLPSPFVSREAACRSLSFPSLDYRASNSSEEWASQSLGAWWLLSLGVLMGEGVGWAPN